MPSAKQHETARPLSTLLMATACVTYSRSMGSALRRLYAKSSTSPSTRSFSATCRAAGPITLGATTDGALPEHPNPLGQRPELRRRHPVLALEQLSDQLVDDDVIADGLGGDLLGVQ